MLYLLVELPGLLRCLSCSSQPVPALSQILIIVSPLMVMMFVASITPGPNNLMLMLAGTRFGFAQTVPHQLGVTCGTVLIICITCAGLGTLMMGHPFAVDCMSVACALYLLWMAVRLLGADAPAAAARRNPAIQSRPMRLHEAVLFQFVNPKVWTMAVAAASIAARFPFSPAITMSVVALTTAAVNSPCIALWAACGKMLRRRLDNARTRRIFDGSMALLVAATAIWIAWPVLGALTQHPR
jgi:threonine/homoserine/homoserine lactone efflux protein